MSKEENILKKYALGWTNIYQEDSITDYTIYLKDKLKCEEELLLLGYKPVIEDQCDTFVTYLYYYGK